jgi:hypothetical protein
VNPAEPEAPGEIYLCPATVGDRHSLANLRCSRGAWFEDEVEAYVNIELVKLVGSTAAFHRSLLVIEGDRVIGCAAHHLDSFKMYGGDFQWAVRLQVMALDLKNQGRRLPDGSRLCDGVFKALATDALHEHEGMPLTAIVANENYRSLAMLERNGRWAQIRSGSRHVRMVGQLRPDDG